VQVTVSLEGGGQSVGVEQRRPVRAARDPYVTQRVFARHEVHETRVVFPRRASE
jgi:hypothetical protein